MKINPAGYLCRLLKLICCDHVVADALLFLRALSVAAFHSGWLLPLQWLSTSSYGSFCIILNNQAMALFTNRVVTIPAFQQLIPIPVNFHDHRYAIDTTITFKKIK